MKQEILDYIEAERPYGYDLLTRLAQIPAPSNHEEQRAKFVCDWFHQNGAPQAFIDQALNVVCPIGVTDSTPSPSLWPIWTWCSPTPRPCP